jgi:hypothetical protein
VRKSPHLLLPPSMGIVVDAIGHTAAISMVQVYAGVEIYVPTADNMSEAHPIARLIGLPLALRLALAVGGAKLAIPVCQALIQAERDEEIARRLDEGASIGDICKAYSLSERMVYYVAERTRSAKRKATQ